MEYKVTTMFQFKVIGFQKEFDYETAYQEIPKFWDEICEKYAANVYAGNEPASPQEKAIIDHCIGEYGVCIDDIGGGKFRYLVAGKYSGGDVPDGMVVYEFPRGDWAVFDCIGPIPESLQSLNTRIFKEWLPGNPDYELYGNANEVPPHVEYSLSDMGKDLFPVFYSIMNWGFKHEKEIYEAKEDK